MRSLGPTLAPDSLGLVWVWSRPRGWGGVAAWGGVEWRRGVAACLGPSGSTKARCHWVPAASSSSSRKESVATTCSCTSLSTTFRTRRTALHSAFPTRELTHPSPCFPLERPSTTEDVGERGGADVAASAIAVRSALLGSSAA